MNKIHRLDYLLREVCPIDGVSVGTEGQNATVRIDFRPEATTEQRTAAQSIVTAFDWSEQAHALWLADRNPEKRNLHAMATAHIADLDTIIGAGSFTNAQRDAAIKKLAQGQKAIVKRLVQLQ